MSNDQKTPPQDPSGGATSRGTSVTQLPAHNDNKRPPYSTLSDPLPDLLKEKCGYLGIEVAKEVGDVVLRINKQKLVELCTHLKNDPALKFNFLVDITAIDWLDSKDDRFEVVYHLMSLQFLFRLRIKVSASETDASVPSVTSLWTGAHFMERETWDMYGVVFKGNPDLRRLLMYDEFQGHPLRKDYPVQGKQPRVPLRMPEVKNTATEMARPSLVQINKRGEQKKHNEDQRGVNRVIASQK